MKELTTERIEDIIARIEMYGHGAGYTADEVLELAKIALSVKQAQPVAYTSVDALDDVSCDLTSMIGPKDAVGIVPLYTMGLPAQVMEREYLSSLKRFDLDMDGCDSFGQDCGADMSEEPDGDYVLFADVVSLLTSAPEKAD